MYAVALMKLCRRKKKGGGFEAVNGRCQSIRALFSILKLHQTVLDSHGANIGNVNALPSECDAAALCLQV